MIEILNTGVNIDGCIYFCIFASLNFAKFLFSEINIIFYPLKI